MCLDNNFTRFSAGTINFSLYGCKEQILMNHIIILWDGKVSKHEHVKNGDGWSSLYVIAALVTSMFVNRSLKFTKQSLIFNNYNFACVNSVMFYTTYYKLAFLSQVFFSKTCFLSMFTLVLHPTSSLFNVKKPTTLHYLVKLTKMC